MDEYFEGLKKAIQEVLSQMDPEAARQFVESFKEKLDEQKRAQENIRSSR